MNREFIPYNLAIEMKAIGFDEPCLAYFYTYDDENLLSYDLKILNDNLKTPLYQQAFRWLYQKLDIEKGVMPLNTESQQLLLKELIDEVSSKNLLV